MTGLDLEISALSEYIIKYNRIDKNAFITSLCTDSRQIQQNDWFICLKGESFDGHDFIEKAISAGAAGIIYEQERNIKGIQVEDTTVFLGKLASLYKKKINPFVISITGSNGKTSVKEMLAATLSEYSGNKVCYSQGNFNNQFGVPYTILGLKPGHKYLIIELGTNHPGEIRYLSEIVNADISVITSISMGHAGNFGSFEKIADEKSDIVRGMKSGGKLFLPENLYENEIIKEKAGKFNIPIVKPDSKCQAVDYHENGTSFIYNNQKLFLSAAGRHQFENCRLVISILEELTKNPGEVVNLAQKLAEFKPVKGRLQKIHNNKYNLWDDSYNANPASFREAIRFVSEVRGKFSFYGAFGMMGELGIFSEDEHRKLGQLAAQSGMSAVFFSSQDEKIRMAFYEGWTSVKPDNPIFIDENTASSLANGFRFLTGQMTAGDHLLVKGSRSTRMERMFEFFN